MVWWSQAEGNYGDEHNAEAIQPPFRYVLSNQQFIFVYNLSVWKRSPMYRLQCDSRSGETERLQWTGLWQKPGDERSVYITICISYAWILLKGSLIFTFLDFCAILRPARPFYPAWFLYSRKLNGIRGIKYAFVLTVRYYDPFMLRIRPWNMCLISIKHIVEATSPTQVI